MRTMKALVKTGHGPGLMELRDVRVPEPGRGEVLVKVSYCGICGTDLKIQDGQFGVNPPVITGHEFSGVIEKMGTDVTGWKPGDRVVSEQHTGACGHCRYCLTGRRQFCPEKRSPGYGVDGAFAGYIRVPASLLHHLPEGISLAEAALAEPMAVAAYGILGRTGIQPEETVVILGCGPVAVLALQMVKAEGASKVIMTGIGADEKKRFGIAKQLGAARVINVTREDPVAIVMEETGQTGADVVIDLSGSPAAIVQGIGLLCKDGRLCAIGLPHGDVAVPWQKAALKAIRVIFSYSSDYESWERSLSMMQNGKVALAYFTQDIYSLDDWEEAFRLARSGDALKVLIQPF